MIYQGGSKVCDRATLVLRLINLHSNHFHCTHWKNFNVVIREIPMMCFF